MEITHIPTDARLEVRLLGELELAVHGDPVKVRSDRGRKLLALLAVNANTPVPFERIVDALWDDPPETARQQVHNVVSQLRRMLPESDGEVRVVTSGTAYRLVIPPDAVDVARFQSFVRRAERAERAGDTPAAVELLAAGLDQWRGPALTGFGSRSLSAAGSLLNDQRYAAAERLAELRMITGEASESVALLTGLLADAPLRESLRAALMKVLRQAGRQADAVALFEEGRRLLSAELGLDPSPVLVEAQYSLLRGGSPDHAPQPAGRPATREPPRRPDEQPGRLADRSYLPRDLAEFTGRADELRALAGFADDAIAGTPTIVVIDGMGGVGKTTLAVHLAHELAGRFRDGQYFVDLAGFSASEPLTPLRALGMLLRCAGFPPERTPSTVEECSAAWRSLTAGRQLLLLLDNAASTTQIRPLLPNSPKSLVFISSRLRMPQLEGAAHLALDTMGLTDAVALFSKIAGPGGPGGPGGDGDGDGGRAASVRSVVELCGFLPLAIQIAAARLRARPAWSVEYLAEQLQDVRARARLLSTGDRGVMEILAWSYRQLPERLKATFRLLAVIPGRDFDSHVVAALAGVPVHAAEDDLEELYDANLLKQDGPRRYHLHDLVRDCSRELLSEDGGRAEFETASARLIGYYLRSAATWCARVAKTEADGGVKLSVPFEPVFVKEAPDRAAAVELLDAEFGNLSAAIRFAADEGFWTQSWQLASCMLPYFAMLNYTGETETLLETALGAARSAQERVGEATCLMGLASVKRVRGFGAESRELITTAMELSREDADAHSAIWQLIDLGIAYLDDGLLDEARSCLLKAQALALESGDKVAQADIANNLAIVSRAAQNFEEALDYFQQAYELDREGPPNQASALTVVNLAYINCLLWNWSRAEALYARAFALSRTTGSKPAEAFSLVGRCIVHRATGRLDEALEFGRAGLDLARRLSLHNLESQALCAIGDVQLGQANAVAAYEVFELALDHARAYSNGQYAARAEEGLAHVYSATGDTAKAAELWARSSEAWPSGVADRAAALRHLSAPEFGAVHCWRCVLDSPGRRGS